MRWLLLGLVPEQNWKVDEGWAYLVTPNYAKAPPKSPTSLHIRRMSVSIMWPLSSRCSTTATGAGTVRPSLGGRPRGRSVTP